MIRKSTAAARRSLAILILALAAITRDSAANTFGGSSEAIYSESGVNPYVLEEEILEELAKGHEDDIDEPSRIENAAADNGKDIVAGISSAGKGPSQPSFNNIIPNGAKESPLPPLPRPSSSNTDVFKPPPPPAPSRLSSTYDSKGPPPPPHQQLPPPRPPQTTSAPPPPPPPPPVVVSSSSSEVEENRPAPPPPARPAEPQQPRPQSSSSVNNAKQEYDAVKSAAEAAAAAMAKQTSMLQQHQHEQHKSPASKQKKEGQREYPTFVEPFPEPSQNHRLAAEKLSMNGDVHNHDEEKRAPALGGTKGAEDADDVGDTVFLAVVSVCSVVGIIGLSAAGYTFYSIHKQYRAAQEVDYPHYGVTGPSKERSSGATSPVAAMDAKLASSAQLYHYQHTKQQIIAMENSTSDAKGQDSDDSEGEGDEGDFSVYECPGLAPTGDIEVNNPLFENIGAASPRSKVDPRQHEQQQAVNVDEEEQSPRVHHHSPVKGEDP